jgi:DNA-binding MarR family transcriptional regulator
MRIGLEIARSRSLLALGEAEMGDLDHSYLPLFQYPPCDGQRPTEIAKRLRMTKQALNHLLGQLEKLGYIERRSAPGSRQATVHYTERAWKVIEVTLTAMQPLETDWIGKIGQSRFAAFKATMKELTNSEPLL